MELITFCYRAESKQKAGLFGCRPNGRISKIPRNRLKAQRLSRKSKEMGFYFPWILPLCAPLEAWVK
jgi:hypothetical protein